MLNSRKTRKPEENQDTPTKTKTHSFFSKTAAALNFEAQSTYHVRVRATDSGGLSVERALDIQVTNENEPPANFLVSKSTVAENVSIGTVVGQLSVTDPDAGDTATFTLVSGAGADDNAKFTIVGQNLKTAVPIDFETKSEYRVRLRATDSGGLSVERTLIIQVTDINEGASLPTSLGLKANIRRSAGVGEPITFTATSNVDPTPLEFEFRIRAENGTWSVAQAYSSATTWTWDTSSAKPNVYNVQVFARIAGWENGAKVASSIFTQRLIVANTPAVRLRESATILVASCDSSEAARLQADFVADCIGDEAEINAAIQALAPIGGIVQLAEGTFHIRATPGKVGGIIIDKSNVILQGAGYGTRLLLDDDQNTNVIRIIGNGLSNITVRDLYVNGNWKKNYASDFDGCGIRAASNGNLPMKNITVERVFAEDAARLNIMLNAQNAQIVNNSLGDSGSDSAEILTGPGIMSGNYAEIDDVTGYVLSTDAADFVNITNNVIKIMPTGRVTQSVIRIWSGRISHIVSNNQIRVEGYVYCMLEANGYLNVITDNIFGYYRFKEPLTRIEINGGTLFQSNLVMHANVNLRNTTDWPSSFSDNLLSFGTTVTVIEDKVFGMPEFVKFEQ